MTPLSLHLGLGGWGGRIRLLVIALLWTAALVPGVSDAGQGRWETHGPPGKVRCIEVSPSKPSTLYVGGSHGIFKSTNGGQSWTAASEGLPLSTDTNDLAIDPRDPSTVYAATQYTGVQKTVDGGMHWAPSSEGLTEGFTNALAIDPSDPETIFAGLTRGVEGGVLFKSTNAGANWVDMSEGIQSLSVRSIVINPVDTRVVYAGTDGDGVVYRSSDGGERWLEMSRGIAPEAIILDLAIDPQVPSIVYAATWLSGLFRTTDSGVHWTRLRLHSPWLRGVVVDPSHPSTVYASGDGVHKSADRGLTWTEASRGLPSRIGHLVIDPVTPSTLYTESASPGAGAAGVFKTTDGGAYWSQHTQGLSGATTEAVAIDPANPDILYAGTQTGIYRSTDGGAQWSFSSGSKDLTEFTDLLIDPSDPDVLYASMFGLLGSSLLKSTDGGKTWAPADDGIDAGFIFDLAMDSSDPLRLAAAAGEVWLSTDGAGSWTQIFSPPYSHVSAVELDPADPGTIYAGTGGDQFVGGELYKSIDGGATWAKILRIPTPSWSVYDIELDPATPSTIYVAPGYLGFEGVVMKSTDGGRTWARLGTNTLPAIVWDLAIDPSDPSTVYAGTHAGVYVSRDAGIHWNPMNDGLISGFVYSIEVGPTGSPLYAGAAGGVFRFDVAPS